MRIFAGAAGALLLASCSKPIDLPTHEFQVPAPATWQGAEVEPNAPSPEWWTYFEDERLDALILKALSCNQNLQAAAARIDTAMEERIMAEAGKLPTLNLGANRLRQRQNFVGLPFPGLSDRVLSNTFSNAGLSFNVDWEPDVWKRVSAQKLAGDATVHQRMADRHSAMLSLSGQAAKAWFAAVEARRQIALAEELMDNARVTSRRTRQRYKFGSRSPVDVRVAEAEVARSVSVIRQRQQLRDTFVRQLEMLACEYPAGDLAVASKLPDLKSRVPAGLPSELVHRRPDLMAAEQALVAADARIVQAKAALRPSFSLTTAAGTSSNTLLDLVNPGLRVWNLAAGLAMPLFNAGSLKANVRATESRAREAAASYENRIWTAYLEVETALSTEGTLLEQERALQDALASTHQAIKLAEKRYAAGLADIFTVLSLKRTALQTESTMLGLRRTRIDNRIDLHLALGGGFGDGPDRPRQPGANP